VGKVAHVDPAPLLNIIESGAIAVMAPIAVEGDAESESAQLLNVNADTAAGVVAAALAAERLIYLTDVAGVLDEAGSILAKLSTSEVERLLDGETISGGMIPKLESAVQAASAGVVTLVADGREKGILRALLSTPDTVVATRIG